MLTQESLVSSWGEPYFFKGNEPLLLDNPERIWLVKSGAWALFAINVENGTPKGRRRYLFSVKPGEGMFSVQLPQTQSPTQTGEQMQIIAVALEESELLLVSQGDFCECIAAAQAQSGKNQTGKEQVPNFLNQTEEFAPMQLLDGWINHLGSAVAEVTSATIPTPAPVPGCAVLAAGEVFQAPHGKVAWVKVLQGSAHLLGFADLEFSTDSGLMPLQTYLWLQAQDILEVNAGVLSPLPGPEVQQLGNILLTGLNTLQRLVLQAISRLEHQQAQVELNRAQQRDRLNQQAISNTLDEFATLFDANKPATAPRLQQTLNREDALLFTAVAVGKFLGITINPPANSEDLRRVRDPIEAIARASQIRVRKITLKPGWWQQDSGPLLAYTLEEDRPVALIPVSDTSYEIIDPIRHKRSKCDRRVAATLAPTAYTFYRPLPLQTKSFIELFQFALQGHYKELWTLMLAGVITTVLGMITPQATAILIDQAIPDADRQMLYQIALGLISTTFGATLFQFTQGVAVMRIETFADTTTQAAIWDRLLKLKPAFFREFSIGDLSARVSVITQMRQKLGSTLIRSLFSSLFSLLNLGLLFYYSLPLALVATLVAFLNIAVTITSGLLTLKKVRPLLNMQGKLFGMMVQIINGVAKFRTAGAEARAFAYWGKQYRHQLQLMMSSQGIEDNLVVINNLLSALTPAILFAIATNLLLQSQANPEAGGSFTTGTFLAFNAAFGTFIGGATSLSTTIIDILEVFPMWERAQPILQSTPEIDTNKADPGRLTGRIAVKNVIFRYRADGALTLDDVSLNAEPGEFIALVGPSGSGKSTLFRLLLGFDSPESGSICYDGQDISGLDVGALRRQLGVVLQNSRLMSASIFENISSNANLTMEEAWEAAKMAGLAEDIQAMPMGMHTVVSEGGTNLSGGQRQRLIIARALALRPSILLFDEATSALDNRTQAIVSESLDKLNVTRIVVAHRLSTIRNANRIYVLENGHLVQHGSFDELAQQPGLFSQLIRRQQI